MKLKHGLVQIYTGNGKGKTTAAFGMALRAAGAGLSVYILQFVKGGDYSELKVLEKIKNIKIEQCGRRCFIKKKPDKIDIKCAQDGLRRAKNGILSKKFDVIVLDEINIALNCGLLKLEDIIGLIKSKPSHVELVLTGRYCPRAILKHADLVTEMKEIKHPYQKGLPARLGIEY